MKTAELIALKTRLSNEARALYCLILRPTANHQTGATSELNYKEIIALLNACEVKITLGRQVNKLIKELQQAGLVIIPESISIDKSLNKKRLSLPLLTIQDDQYQLLHKQRSSMISTWTPDADLFKELAQLVGLIDKEFNNDDVGDFVAYWLGRPESQFSQFQWTQKFVTQVKQRRLAKQTMPVKRVGSQLTTAKSGIEVDDNARKLVEKYATKQ